MQIGSPIVTFVKNTLTQLDNLSKDYTLHDKIDFELSVVETDKEGGGVDLRVIKYGGDSEVSNIHKVKFSIIHQKETSETKKLLEGLKKLKNKPNQ